MTIVDLAFASLRVLGFWFVLQAILSFFHLMAIRGV
jgi:hypothetical protein